jgi:hypothetical protein
LDQVSMAIPTSETGMGTSWGRAYLAQGIAEIRPLRNFDIFEFLIKPPGTQ